MSTHHALHVMRNRLGKQVDRNIALSDENRKLRERVAELEAERRRMDSRLVRVIRWVERRFS